MNPRLKHYLYICDPTKYSVNATLFYKCWTSPFGYQHPGLDIGKCAIVRWRSIADYENSAGDSYPDHGKRNYDDTERCYCPNTTHTYRYGGFGLKVVPLPDVSEDLQGTSGSHTKYAHHMSLLPTSGVVEYVARNRPLPGTLHLC